MAPRRPRDIEAELKALQDRAKQLRSKQKAQLGELLIATGAADTLGPDALTGLLLEGLERARADASAAAGWAARGEAFFRRERAEGRDGVPDAVSPPLRVATPAEPLGRAAPPPPRQAAE